MKSPLPRLIVPLAAGAVMVFGLTACGGDDSTESSGSNNVSDKETTEEDSGGTGELRNGPVPDADPMDWEPEDELPEEPGNDAPLAERIEYDLLEEGAKFAKAYDEDATVECPDAEFGKNQDITCDMTYFGQSLSHDVAIESSSDTYASYNSETEQVVISQQVAEDKLRFETESEDVACEMDEEYALVTPGSEGEGEVVCHSDGDDGQTSWDLSLSGNGNMSFYEQR